MRVEFDQVAAQRVAQLGHEWREPALPVLEVLDSSAQPAQVRRRLVLVVYLDAECDADHLPPVTPTSATASSTTDSAQ